MPKNPKDDTPPGGDSRFTLEDLPASGKIRNAPRLDPSQPPRRVRLIAKVRTPGYVPPNVEVGARIDPHLFTANCSTDDLQALANDPQVESVEIAEVLQPTTRG